MDLKVKIREIPNWPKPGVNFKDITTLLSDPEAFKEVINSLGEFFVGKNIDKVMSIDARGFLVAAPVAYKIGAGLIIARKPGKLPFSTIKQEYTLEYANNIIEMHNDAIVKGEKVVLIDDLIATGGTAIAACDLVEKLGGTIAGIGAIIDLPYLDGSKKLAERGYEIKYLVSYDRE